MEFQFQTADNQSMYRSRNRTASKNKFVGVRQRPSGKWVAEIKNTTQKIRMWLGTFDTAEEAAQAYDEAACLLRGSNTRTNFLNNMPCNPALSLKIRNLFNQKRRLNKSGPNSVSSSSNKTTTISTSQKSSNLETKTLSFGNSLQDCSNQSFTSNPINVEDAYRPDLGCFMGGYDMMSANLNQYNQDSTYAGQFDKVVLQQDGLLVPNRAGDQMNEAQYQDFERMKFERQVSASLYAMNGINEYWDNINDISDPFWDIPTLCQMFCPS